MGIGSVKNLVSEKFRTLQWDLLKVFSKTTVVHTDVFDIEIYTKDDAIGRNFFFYGHYGFEELQKAYDFLKANNLFKKGTFIDIGANIGFMALYAVTTDLASNAFCFEPDINNFSLLERNIKRNKFSGKIKPYQIGLGSTPGEAKFIISPDNLGDHRVFTENEVNAQDKYNTGERKIFSIKIDTLDNFYNSELKDHEVSFICLDVQGFELEVLKGGEAVLVKSPALMMETDPYLLEKKGCTIDELQHILQKYYTVFLDLSLEHPTQLPIQHFHKFYGELQQSKVQHKDILFLKP